MNTFKKELLELKNGQNGKSKSREHSFLGSKENARAIMKQFTNYQFVKNQKNQKKKSSSLIQEHQSNRGYDI